MLSKLLPSIFNEAIGPVMRGPSGSHVAAAYCMGRLIRVSLKEAIVQAIVDFDTHGSLAEPYHGHGSDKGFVMGMDLTDPRVEDSLQIAKQENLDVQFRILDCGAP